VAQIEELAFKIAVPSDRSAVQGASEELRKAKKELGKEEIDL